MEKAQIQYVVCYFINLVITFRQISYNKLILLNCFAIIVGAKIKINLCCGFCIGVFMKKS